MTRVLPRPLVSASLLAAWLLLNQSVSLGHILLGAVLALAGPLTLAALDLPRGGPRRLLAVLRLGLIVVVEITRSNIAVARIILGPPGRQRRSGFVAIPLDATSPYALAVLAGIITATPGTVWVTFDAVTRVLTLHVLDLIDEEEWRRIVKQRYERPLMEIFE